MVLQSAAKGKEDDSAQYTRRRHNGGYATGSPEPRRSSSGLSSAGSPARFAHGSQPQSTNAQPSGPHGPLARGSLAFAGASPVGPRGNLAELGECVVNARNDDFAAVLSSLPSSTHRQLHDFVADRLAAPFLSIRRRRSLPRRGYGMVACSTRFNGV